MPSTLRFGAKGPEVADLVNLLTSRGCAPRPPVTSSAPKFGRAIENMVLYFQMTHQGPDAKWLAVDGVVGKDTWWALKNATGGAQRSFLEAGIPQGIVGQRRSVLDTAVREHGVREDADRPNRGEEVDKYLPAEVAASASKPGPPWCCYFVSWVIKEVFGRHLLGQPVASVHSAWQHARRLKRWEPKGQEREPTPGDAFVLLHKDPRQGWCTGHIGFVLQVAGDGRSYNTVEGNCGNRVKIGRRNMDDPLLRGFVNIIGDHPEFTRGSLRGAQNLGAHGTR
ncbi:MAG: peptidoglycan-binding domain-containing protein [Deltaproteobacteria bacterium]|nr:peptidoglycan-binding domain-containing protein [Deltaproteobacteria bacterium]